MTEYRQTLDEMTAVREGIGQVTEAIREKVRQGIINAHRPVVAVHEAGHAVLSRREGIASGSLVLREDGTGEHRFQGIPLEHIDPDALVLPRDRHLVERVVRVYLAGNEAQLRMYPGSPHRDDGHDLATARGLLGMFVEIDQRHDPNASVDTYLDVLREEVRAALAEDGVWREVRALANALLAHGTLEGEQIVRICEAATKPETPQFREVMRVVRDERGFAQTIVKTREVAS
jgi:hypothetical protein